MRRVYMYVVQRDFGFAPNPFHGYCTLATCKPGIRRTAKVDDWGIGMGGSRLRATKTITFNEYWPSLEFLDKRPVRHGSNKMMVGDNIYHLDVATNEWRQA